MMHETFTILVSQRHKIHRNFVPHKLLAVWYIAATPDNVYLHTLEQYFSLLANY